MKRFDMDAFIEERNAALLSLDEKTIRVYMRKHQIKAPYDLVAFWGGVHKARMQIVDMPEAEQAVSRTWLDRHGFVHGTRGRMTL